MFITLLLFQSQQILVKNKIPSWQVIIIIQGLMYIGTSKSNARIRACAW